MATSESLKEFFHKRGIHSTTIQPEFVRDSTDSALKEASCVLVCKTDACDSQRCCKRKSEDSSQGQRKASAVAASPKANGIADSANKVLENKV
ncbi:zinc transporter 1-like [Anneissia japonica]|nr:zinc transporter 1-like [Anneissia japonica]XP_033098510.1 zinc transporter 1-like [Anneissia japonica]